MNVVVVVDLLLVILAVAYVVVSARRGLLYSVTSAVGFVALGGLALYAVPILARAIDAQYDPNPSLLALGAIAVIVSAAWSGAAMAGALGANLRNRVDAVGGKRVDRLLGGCAGVAMVVVTIAAAADLASGADDPVVASYIDESEVIAAARAVVPASVTVWAGRLGTHLDESGALPEMPGFPELPAPAGAQPVPSPDLELVKPAAQQAAGSVVKITGNATACRQSHEGTGFVIAPGRVLTNAHVVSAVDKPNVQVSGQGRKLPAQVVYFDPEQDVAVLSVRKLDAPALKTSGPLRRGAAAVVVGFPLDGPYTVSPARVKSLGPMRGTNVYNSGDVIRQTYSVLAQVRPGNSGGPLLDERGDVVGLVFARSADDENTGFAIDVASLSGVISRAPAMVDAAETGPCRDD